MFRNYFITAWRNFLRNRVFSVINILGLAIGISASLVIFLIVYYEESYDRFEPGKERIFRVVLDANYNGSEGHSAGVPAPLGSTMEREVTGTELTIPIFQFQGDGTTKVSIVNNNPEKPAVFKKQKEVVFTNAGYFNLLDYKWLVGSPRMSMENPFSLVLTESRAHQYFPDVLVTDLIGRQVIYNDETSATISGIVKDLGENTTFSGKEFLSIPTILKTRLKDNFMMTVWNDWMAYSQLYVKLAKGSSKEAIELQVKKLYGKYNPDKKNPNAITFRLQPLNEIHFDATYQSVGQRIANKYSLYGLLAVTAFLLLLGCINFINLSTAQASQRAREIGIRKTMGSSRTQLIGQYLIETFILTSIATILSLLMTPLLLNVFADFIPQGLHFDLLQQPSLILFLVLLTVVVSFLAGMYPALILSNFNPSKVLKNQAFVSSGETRGAWLRKTLTVSQFVIAQFFIIGTLLVSKQIHYALNKDLGFNKEAILTFDTPRDSANLHNAQLLHEINAIPEVELASSGFLTPAGSGMAITNISYKEKEGLKANVQLRFGDSNYLKLYRIKILAGRNVQHTDSFQEFLINETYAKLLGFEHPEDALHKKLTFNGKDLPIVGIMKDFHTQSVHAALGPLVFAGGQGSIFHIKLKPNGLGGNQWQTAIGKIRKSFQQVYPESDFNYTFLDDNLAQLYKNEQDMSRLLIWATGLMIFISCLGLLGLVIYTTDRRRKEIGIRKILGASITNIVSILSSDFVRLLVIAFLVAAPVAWFSVHKWLENFAYRTAISWWIFIVTIILIVLFAFITLSIQTIRAAIANPVKSLRTE